MKRKNALVSMGVVAVLAVAGAMPFATKGSENKAQTPPAPCACSRLTPITGADEVTIMPGQFQPRLGVAHCQCGTATCVSQVSYGSPATHQLFCVR